MELTIAQLIKIIIGVLVVGVVAFGIYMFVSNYVLDFFKSYGDETGKVVLTLLK